MNRTLDEGNWTSQASSRPCIPQLRAAILDYVDAHNQEGKPFKWTKTADEILDKMRRFGLRTQKAHGNVFQEIADPGD